MQDPQRLVPRNRIAIGLEVYAFSQRPPAEPYPLAYIKRMPERIVGFHVKDWNGKQAPSGTSDATTQTDLGEGVIDFHRIFSALEQPERYWFTVEREGSPDPNETMRKAYAYLANLHA